MKTGEIWAGLGSSLASIMFLYTIFQQYLPYNLRNFLEKYIHKVTNYFNPYIEITVCEFTGERLKSNEAYTVIQAYLSTNSSKRAKRLKADIDKNTDCLALSMDDREEVTDDYKGAMLWWKSTKSTAKTQQFSFYPTSDEKRSYKLSFHKRYRQLVIDSYLNHVLKEGRAIGVSKRQRKLFMNNPSRNEDYRRIMWSHAVFDHPSSFQTLAMDPQKKKEIMDDLETFSKSKDYYAKIGKAWKRGYLLHGPPGTGKSTMIAAMANHLNYDVYDLELTSVKNNTELRKLLIETSNKAIIVIEDIDCSLDLTSQRTKKNEKEEEKNVVKKAKEEINSNENKVTLSGLLNFIDGLWSSCGGERLIVFTTNYVEKLDPALIRRGRMDKHIEMSYCGFEGFKVLAKNYLDIDFHILFETIEHLLLKTQITPADIAENLMPKTSNRDAETSLKNLIQALEIAK
ncbi:hypothetical protein GIB67_005821 [Kingdonia uniflora]|uniref:AAA+ ATPase domain-containing protein n=1 Tax=Kingdonia uniflora TaxID=39325 RepID=A0A7J7LU51_9MAGN|nr:hypothetical protein GIB67_005821 [Kingdonia uniflora]